MALRGVQVGGLLRYLEPTAFGETRFEYNPQDLKADATRYQFASLHTFSNFYGWFGNWNVKGVSDDNYFIDYARTIISSSERSLPRDLNALKVMGDWTLKHSYRRGTRTFWRRETRRPMSACRSWRRFMPSAMCLAASTSMPLLMPPGFAGPCSRVPRAPASSLIPAISYPVIRPGWFVTPESGHALVVLSTGNAIQVSQLQSIAVCRPFSVDSGLIFERPARFFDRDVIQTLEPRLFYSRTPFRDQTGIPVFDTATADFNFAQLFSENTFIGNDRIADVNQVTAAAVSRIISPESGREALRVAVGQRYYLSDQRVSIPNVASRTDRRSDILLAAGMNLGDGRSLDAGIQYAVADGSLPRGNIAYRQFSPNGRIFNVGVRYLRDELGQFDTSWRQPVSARWTTLGRINYSFLNKRIDPATGILVDSKPGIIEGLLGFEYIQDCWTFRFVFQRFITAAATPTTAWFFQMDLNGLGRVGSSPFEVLRRNIPGYRLPNDRPLPGSKYSGYE